MKGFYSKNMSNKSFRFLAIIILCAVISPSLAEVYRWKDDSGKIVFGDRPPKNKSTTTIEIDNTKNSGAQFASPGQVDNFKRDAETRSNQNMPSVRSPIDSHCRTYVSQLNQIEIYLEHTVTQRDQQKARDLRKLIKKECGNTILTQKFDDSRCARYREDLSKLDIYLEHTITKRDQQKAIDLRQQIAHECQ